MSQVMSSNDLPESTKELLLQAQSTFQEKFSAKATHGAFAPGRVNLIGEHTDYNDGFVFPIVRVFKLAQFYCL